MESSQQLLDELETTLPPGGYTADQCSQQFKNTASKVSCAEVE